MKLKGINLHDVGHAIQLVGDIYEDATTSRRSR